MGRIRLLSSKPNKTSRIFKTVEVALHGCLFFAELGNGLFVKMLKAQGAEFFGSLEQVGDVGGKVRHET